MCEQFFIVILMVDEDVSIRFLLQYRFRKNVHHFVQPGSVSCKMDEMCVGACRFIGAVRSTAIFFVSFQKCPVFRQGKLLKFFWGEAVLCQGEQSVD